eukprot:TRINITY_DN7198_c0_g1_i1.p1 TRINITY_DN7198_c0_g1~~TRINITY_DN7198_c0_g1_i1.p1  ORF type:complete len:514 (+),score=175.25 TRINITY_DN7198_c0_g1_i1:147-1544(+)
MAFYEIESWGKKEYLIFLGAWTGMFAFALLIGGVGPDPVVEQVSYSNGCVAGGKPVHHNVMCLGGHNMQLNTSVFPITLSKMSSLNKFFAVELGVYNKENQFFGLDKSLEVSVAMFTKQTPDAKDWTFSRRYLTSHKLTCVQGKPQCNNITVFFEEFVTAPEYKLEIQFTNVQGAVSHNWVGDVQATAVYLSTAYSQFLLGWRIALVLVDIALLIAFFQLAKRNGLDNNNWSYDTKSAAGMLVGGILLNDPFFLFQYAAPGVFFNVINAAFGIAFSCFILFYWLVVLDKLRVDELRVQVKRFYGPKIILVALHGIFLFVASVWVIVGADYNPIPSRTSVVEEGARTLFIMAVLVNLVIFGYLGYLVYQCILVIRMKPELKARFVYLGCPAVFLILMNFAFVFIRLAGTNDLAMNFFFNLWMSNTYVWAIVYAFWPREGTQQYTQQRDDAGFVDDGEDDMEPESQL